MNRDHLAYRVYAPSPHNRGLQVIDHRVVERDDRRYKVAILGTAPSKQLAPLADPDWEVWALNLSAPIDTRGLLRCDRWFDIHQRLAQSDDDLRWIARCPVPLYVPDDLVEAGPTCVRYPIESVERNLRRSYWACTFAYQIALAIELRFGAIGLFGIDLHRGTERERTVEWACLSWWCGYAEAHGIRLEIPEGTWLGYHPARYGLEYDVEIESVQYYVDRMREAALPDETPIYRPRGRY